MELATTVSEVWAPSNGPTKSAWAWRSTLNSSSQQISRGTVADYAGCFTAVCGVSCLTLWCTSNHCNHSCFRSTCSGADFTTAIVSANKPGTLIIVFNLYFWIEVVAMLHCCCAAASYTIVCTCHFHLTIYVCQWHWFKFRPSCAIIVPS